MKYVKLSIIILLVHACGTTSQEETVQEEWTEQEATTLHDIDALLKDMPPPSLVPFTLQSIGAAFDPSLVHSTDNLSRYGGNQDKLALIMGVYASDLSYLAAYKKEEECLEYMSIAHSIAETLGDSSIYDQSDLNEMKGHIASSNHEEIAATLSKLFLETSMKMEDTHHLNMAGLALTGSFIEGLYHAVVSMSRFDNSSENQLLLEPLVNTVLGEEKPLLDVIQVLDDLPYNQTVGELLVDLKILDGLFKGDLQKVKQKMESDPDYIVSKKEMRDISLEVKKIRKSIVE